MQQIQSCLQEHMFLEGRINQMVVTPQTDQELKKTHV